MSAADERLSEKLRDLERRQLYRHRRLVEAVGEPPNLCVDGRDRLVFCSNDYLGLSQDPRLVTAFETAAGRWGTGSGASHLITGHCAEHHALEEEIAEFTGRQRALLFSTGYMANVGVIDALAGQGDIVVSDQLNHASLIDGARISGAEIRRYRHADAASARQCLVDAGPGQRLIITDGVFSMDGDVAPLAELATAALAGDAMLMVDDAHGMGVIGDTGSGSVCTAGLDQDAVPVLMGTFGKAFGSFGAFVAGSEALVETLVNRARTYVFTTALPAPVAAATRVALSIVREESWRREHLADLIGRFRKGASELGLTLPASETPIQPVIIGSDGPALEISEYLWEKGFWISAIRPPTVPEGSARLRITLSACHSREQIDALLDVLGRCRMLVGAA